MPDPIRITSLRDLDAVLLENAFGWKRVVFRGIPEIGCVLAPFEPSDNSIFQVAPDGHPAHQSGLLSSGGWVDVKPTTDPAAAYALRQRMRELGYEMDLLYTKADGLYVAAFWRDPVVDYRGIPAKMANVFCTHSTIAEFREIAKGTVLGGTDAGR